MVREVSVHWVESAVVAWVEQEVGTLPGVGWVEQKVVAWAEPEPGVLPAADCANFEVVLALDMELADSEFVAFQGKVLD